MKPYRLLIPLLALILFISSCEFQCKVGSMDENQQKTKATGPVKIGNALVYNNIQITSNKLALNKAYLVFENGERVPNDNFVEFSSPIKLLLLIDSGWTVNNMKVKLGASEKVTNENGVTELEQQDLFADYPEGVSAEDARIIGLTISIKMNPGAPPTWFKVNFRVWDKNSDGYIEGHYKLFSK